MSTVYGSWITTPRRVFVDPFMTSAAPCTLRRIQELVESVSGESSRTKLSWTSFVSNIQHREVERDGEDLVRPQRGIVRIEDVVEILAFAKPEARVERLAHARRQVGVLRCVAGAVLLAQELIEDPQRVVVEGVDLDRLPAPWRHHPVIDLRVHPC